jgi:CHAT domain-containing protein/tetratricopeptide (TPR) repeat protein
MAGLGCIVALVAVLGLSGTGTHQAAEPARPAAEQKKLLEKARRYQEEGMRLIGQGKGSEAIAAFRKKLSLERRAWGAQSPRLLVTLRQLAVLLELTEDFGAARAARKEIVAINTKVWGEKHWETAESRCDLADSELRARLDRGQRQRLLQAAEFTRQAIALQKKDKYREAVALLLQVLQIRKELCGVEHYHYAISLNNLAVLYQDMGFHARSVPLLQQASRIYRRTLGDEHPAHATVLNNLGLAYEQLGLYGKAESLLEEALRVRKGVLGDRNPLYAQTLNNLGMVYDAVGKYAQARRAYQEALRVYERGEKETNPDYPGSLFNLADLYGKMGLFARAESLFEQARRIYEKTGSKRDPGYATCLHNQASLYKKQGQYDKAEALLREACRLRKEILGERHPLYATSVHNLGCLYHVMGLGAKAEPLYEEARRIFERALGDQHPDYAIFLGNLADLYADTGRWGKAGRAQDQAQHILRRHAGRVLPGLPEAEQLAFLGLHHSSSLHVALSLGLARRRDAGTVTRSAEWLLNGKALAQEALAQQTLWIRDHPEPEVAEAIQELLAVRQRLARLALQGAPVAQAEEHRRLDELAAREQELAKKLGRTGGRALLGDPWVHLDRLRRALPEDAILVDVARFPVRFFPLKAKENPWRPARYAAWVIPPAGQGDVQLIDLGPARDIEQSAQRVRKALAAAARTLATHKEAAAERELRTPLAELSRRVLRPLLPACGKSRHWLVSPDAALWLVPWAVLPLADGSYAVEKYRVSYLVSGRDLLAPRRQTKAGPPLLLADPDFDLEPVRPTRAAPAGAARRPASRLPRFPRLPGTALEARAVTPLLKRYTAEDPLVRTGRQASESAFKAVRHPKLVLLGTHGFFLEDQDEAVAVQLSADAGRGLKMTVVQPPRQRREQVQILENPLLRCGLALAGANHSARAPEGADDGILTGLEIVGTDLRGTELVVLSACETGLGQVRNGEGVAGLRQAFQLAGARAVVATLWQIPDKETTALMTAFFEELAAKKGKAEALRRAQLQIIKERRAKHKAAHPFYWAAFTLTGWWQ